MSCPAADRLVHSEQVESLSQAAVAQAVQQYADQHPNGDYSRTQVQFRSYSSITAYREDSVGLVASGSCPQANPTLRYTIRRAPGIVVMWRHSPPQHPTATSVVSDSEGQPTAIDLDSFAGINSTMTIDSDGSGTSSFTNYIGPTSSAAESGTITWTAAK